MARKQRAKARRERSTSKYLADKLWAPTAAGPFIAAHLKTLMDYPPSQGADTLSLKKALENAQDMMQRPNRAGN